MIYDRTKEDIISAINIFNSKFIKGIDLTEEDVYALERGMVTSETLNRIEEKQEEISISLKNMSYSGADIINKKWGDLDFFYKEDLERIVENVAKLRKAFFVLSSTPQNPRPEYNYREFNLIERVLHDIGQMIEYAEQNYKICGEYYCGS